MIIAIDGPAGSGKSTIAKILADKLSFIFLNTGSFYRCVALALLRSRGSTQDGSGVLLPDVSDEQQIINFASQVPLSWRDGNLFLGDEDVSGYLRSDAVEAIVAPLSAIVEVRHIVNIKIRFAAQGHNVICEGRDMTTVVFPDAEYKFYLDASVDSRAKRRFEQGTSSLSIEEIRSSIAARDEIDRNKKEGSLKIADDALYIDTSDLTIQDVCDMMISKIHL